MRRWPAGVKLPARILPANFVAGRLLPTAILLDNNRMRYG